MQARVPFMLAGILCFFLAPLSSEAQENDKWGPWGEWTPCSRTCGVGVSYQKRECLEKEKPEDYCKGNERVRRTTCNIQDCPEGSRDFRLEQCEAYNNRTVDGQKYKWMPYVPSHERCALNCMPKGKYFYFRWADKVVDGTRCSVDSYDICVDGKCEKLGCDLILNSNAKEDKCRVCNGNGDTCKTYKGVNREDGDGYKEIIVIPASATNIDIQEMAPSSNFLALSDSSRSYFFNGDYVIENPKKLLIAGTVFNYERTRFDQERIYSLGPTSVPVHVELLFLGEKNPGISYEFSVPKSVTKLPERAQFSWRTGEFDKCSATCSGGEQKRRVYCVRDDNGEEVSKSNCDDNKKPSHKQRCNTQPCPASWFISAWSTCSLTCGRGKMVRRVHCQHIVEGGDAAMIPDEQCPDLKPITMRTCQMQKSCPDWSVSEWSKCNVSCGQGFKHRNVTCQTLDTEETLQPDRCNLAFRPNDKEQCNPGPCTVTWMASDWSECYPNCGKGMSTRMVYCVSISDKSQKYPDDLCDESSRPINEKDCFSDAQCPPMWHASQWSKCTATCGVGMQMRNVLCGQRVGPKMLRILSSDHCSRVKRMNGMQKCSVRPCQAAWYIYPWEPCSKTCGQGVKRRKVKCFADSKEDPEEKWCKAEHKPLTEEQCFKKECKVPTTAATTTTQTTEAVTTKRTTPSTAIPSTTATEITTAAVQEITIIAATTIATTVPTTLTKKSTTTESAEVTTAPEEEEETSTATTITQETTTKVTEKETTVAKTATTITEQDMTTEAAEQTTTESVTELVTTVPEEEETSTMTTQTPRETTATTITDQKTTTEAVEQTTTESATELATTVAEGEETSTATTITQETTEADEQTTTESATELATTVAEGEETSTATTITQETTEADEQTTTESATELVTTATEEKETSTAITVTQETTTDQDTTTEVVEQTTTVPATTESAEVTTAPKEKETTTATTITKETTKAEQERTTEAVEQTTESATELVTTVAEGEETSTATTITQETATTTDQERTTEAVEQTTTKESTTETDTEVTTAPDEETTTATTIIQETTTTTADQERTTEAAEQTTTESATEVTTAVEEKETSTTTTITQETTTETAEEITTTVPTTTTIEAATEEKEPTTATTIIEETITATDQETTTEAAEQTTTESATEDVDTEVTTAPDEEETSTATAITQVTTTDQDTTTEAVEQTTTESATEDVDTEVTTEPDEEETSTATTITQVTTAIPITQETQTTTDEETTTEAAELTTTEADTEVTTTPEEKEMTTETVKTQETITDEETTTDAVEQTTTKESATEVTTVIEEKETSTATPITQETTTDQETTIEAAEQTTTKESGTTEVTTAPEEKETSTATTFTQETTTAEQEATTEAVEETAAVPATTKTSTTAEAVTEDKETTTATSITEETKTDTKEEKTTAQDTTTETAEQTTSPTPTEETTTSQVSSTITTETSSTTVGVTTPETSTTTPPPTTAASATTTPPPTTAASATTTPPPTTTTAASTTSVPTTEAPTTARKIIPAEITEPPKDTMAYVGAEVLFRCRATGYPKPLITWRKGSIPVSSLDSSRIQILSNGDLRITDITEDNDDIYTCTATNFVGPMDNRQARLDVIVPVAVSVSPTNTTAQAGDDIKIACTSVGVPEPEVEWYKNGDLLNSQERVRVSRTEVVISQVQASDSGYYKCQAHHNYGSASDRMFLNVIRKEEPTTSPTTAKCEDNPIIAHCGVVRQVGFCCIKYYMKACCKTCEDRFPSCES